MVVKATQQHVAVVIIDALETAVHFFFLAEGLHRRDAGKIFLQTGVEPAEHQAALSIHLTGAASEKSPAEKNQRKSGEADERQLPVEPEHHYGDSKNDRHVAHQTHHAGAEKLVERGDVV